ncbi:hypothetical protein DRE_02818 [Drechslerella stenobrocha 248]|uniref:VWFA domain-containing protein n=1 Tax=Drechslerella stenobrocha 248 TaxID=1043628 RepID=W7HUP2_9PEZI|nr:hypothetical protein DRE_02818 [Drechslerella stenobrocha 248]
MEVDAPPPYEEQSAPAGITLNIHEYGKNNFLVSVVPPREPVKTKKGPKRAPLDLCCVIDVSGSMEESAPAPAESAGKAKEDTGLTILDVVQHAMKTIIATLDDNDRLAIIAFDSRAELITNFQYSTEAGKKLLNTCVNKLEPKASTNLWDGLKMGMNLLHDLQNANEGSSTSASAKKSEGRIASLFILTDGQPNVNPPRGHIPMLQQWLESNPDTRFAINSFGFGYDLDSALMSDIARAGGGHYGFIADAGMVGTVFVHALANLFSTYATACYINLEVPDGAKVKKPIGEFNHTESSWGAKIDIGDLQYGQAREFIFEIEGLADGSPEDITVTIVGKPWDAQEAVNIPATLTTSPEPNAPSKDYEYHLHRLTLVSSIYALCAKKKDELLAALDEYKEIFQTQAKNITSGLAGHAAAEALATDIGGEVTLAVSDRTAYNKWGRHYFPSLARAHQMQRCNNFKDPGLQVYGQNSPLFTQSRDFADAEFDKLPPPTPSAPQMPASYGSYSRGGAPPVQRTKISSMSRYNVRGGVCFTGDCLATLADGTKARMDTLRRGTTVLTAKGPVEVGGVIKTKVTGRTLICRIGETKVTPWHPVHYNGKWMFPADISRPVMESCDAVYSVLLLPSPHVDAHTMFVNDLKVVTLGHGLVDDEYELNGGDVRNHSFFGSYADVFDGMKELPGFFEDGVCECEGVARDAESRLIKGFVAPAKDYSPVDTGIGQAVIVGA